jgi:hypothetical protein
MEMIPFFMKEEFEEAGFGLERIGWKCVYCSQIFNDIEKRDRHGIEKGTEIEDKQVTKEQLEKYYEREQVFKIVKEGNVRLVPERHRWRLDN